MTAVTPLSGLAQRMPIIGKLKSGVFQGNRPRAIDTWRLTTSSRPFADDFANRYGGEVEPFNNPKSPHDWQVTSESDEVSIILIGEQGYSVAYELWSGGGCQRRCDGVTVEVMETTGPDSVEYTPNPCICDRKGVLECSLKSRLTFALPDLPFRGGLVYESGSKNFAEEAQGMLRMIQQLQAQGINRGVLRLEQRRSSGNRKFTIATVGVTESLEALASGNAGMGALGRAPERFADSESPALSAGEPENPGSGSPSHSSEVEEGEASASEEPTIEEAADTLEDIVDAEIIEDDEPPAAERGDPAERAQLNATFHGIIQGAGLKYDEAVRPWLEHHYGTSLSGLPIDKYRALVAKLNSGTQAEKQEARKKFKVSVQEHAEAAA